MNQPAKDPADRSCLDEGRTNTAAQAETLHEMTIHQAALQGPSQRHVQRRQDCSHWTATS
eukprot:403337447